MSITPDRDRATVLLSIFALCILAWAYLIHMATVTPTMTVGKAAVDMALPAGNAWGLPDFFTMFAMWSVMMVAMMLPSAVPMILLYGKINQKRGTQGRARESAALFVAGYLLVWIGFSAVATLLNWGLHSGGLLHFMMGQVTPVVAGVVLLTAGTYQWTPLKYACLAYCRSPVGFLMAHWRDGRWGGLSMGIHHGLYCLGCCWLLMALLFVLGVMNLLWIAALTIFVLAEKVIPRGHLVGRTTGLLMIAWGGWLVILSV